MTASALSPVATAAGANRITARDYAATGGRALIASIFLLSGMSKLTDPAGTLAYIESVGLPFPHLAYLGAIAVEILGALALVLGYRTRLVALVIAAFSIVTAVFFHAAWADPNQFIHFFKNVAIAGGLLQVAVIGGGRLSLDRH
jgi:putative oxidoreductase